MHQMCRSCFARCYFNVDVVQDASNVQPTRSRDGTFLDIGNIVRKIIKDSMEVLKLYTLILEKCALKHCRWDRLATINGIIFFLYCLFHPFFSPRRVVKGF